MVDRIPRPCLQRRLLLPKLRSAPRLALLPIRNPQSAIRNPRNRRSPRRYEGPVFRPLRALLDPALEQLFLRFGELAIRLRRRHHLVAICAQDACDEFAFRDLSRRDDREAVLIFPQRASLLVQPQLRFARGLVGAVAVVAVLREDRLDVAVEVHLFLRGAHARRRGERHQHGERGFQKRETHDGGAEKKSRGPQTLVRRQRDAREKLCTKMPHTLHAQIIRTTVRKAP